MPPILRGLDLSLRAGERVAIVGSIGSGKSTVLRLLARFADPDGGRILIDGHDIRGGTQESLRRQIGVVFQDGLLLDDTIRENIRLGKLDAKDSEVEAVSALVGLHDIVERLPRGYDTVVGMRGERLSGGQRQLVAIARAMLRDPAILLLDEPTSALDAYSDRIVRLAIEHVSRGPTVIAVTHRRALAAEADRVLVMKDGRLVEDGTHATLMQRGHGVFPAVAGGAGCVTRPRALGHVVTFREASLMGSERTRMPVAAKMALVTAAATGGTAGSPSPPRCASDRMNSTWIAGASTSVSVL